MSKNDEKILALKTQIKEKKTKLGTKKRFIPITNCSIDLDGQRLNLQVLSKEQLINTLVKLNLLRMSAEDLGVSDYKISGYEPSEWMIDIKSKLEIIQQRDEETHLQTLESKLHTLLSSDKKVELEIDDIESMLK